MIQFYLHNLKYKNCIYSKLTIKFTQYFRMYPTKMTIIIKREQCDDVIANMYIITYL